MYDEIHSWQRGIRDVIAYRLSQYEMEIIKDTPPPLPEPEKPPEPEPEAKPLPKDTPPPEAAPPSTNRAAERQGARAQCAAGRKTNGRRIQLRKTSASC